MFGFDFKSGYNHIEVFEEHQMYLVFSWDRKWRHRDILFLRASVRLIHGWIHFDESLQGVGEKLASSRDPNCTIHRQRDYAPAQTYELCEQNSKFVQDSLANAGFVIYTEKTHWPPSQQLAWLGNRNRYRSIYNQDYRKTSIQGFTKTWFSCQS